MMNCIKCEAALQWNTIKGKYECGTCQEVFHYMTGGIIKPSDTVLIVSHLVEDRSRLDQTVPSRDGLSMSCGPECLCSSLL